MNRRVLTTLMLVAALVLGVGVAGADVGKKVIATFKGQVLISDKAFVADTNDKTTIAAFKKQRVSSVKGEKNAEDVVSWTFSYAAFPSRLGATELKLEFYNPGGKYVADRRLIDVDPKDPLLVGDISISEDDGPAAGTTYTLKLVALKNGKEAGIVGQTKLTLGK